MKNDDTTPHAVKLAATTQQATKPKHSPLPGGTAHALYTDADKDRPDVICDSNGQVTLDLCKRCGKGESELFDDNGNMSQCSGA